MGRKNDLVILYSGGADSRLMLEFCRAIGKNPLCLMIDYSQLHSEELEKAKNQLQNLNVDYQVVKLQGLNLDSGLTGDGVRGRFGEHVSEWHVPGRNTMFSSIAFSVAENLAIEEIWLGADYSDVMNDFVDCKQEFIERLNHLFEISGSYPIRVRAPLLGMDKETILIMLKSYGINLDQIYSGYGHLQEENNYDYEERPTGGLKPKGKGSRITKEELEDHLQKIKMLYTEYIHLPTIIPSYQGPLFTDRYRLEGLDPLENGYGIVYVLNDDARITCQEDLEQYKYIVEIVDLEEVREKFGGKY